MTKTFNSVLVEEET